MNLYSSFEATLFYFLFKPAYNLSTVNLHVVGISTVDSIFAAV